MVRARVDKFRDICFREIPHKGCASSLADAFAEERMAHERAIRLLNDITSILSCDCLSDFADDLMWAASEVELLNNLKGDNK